MGSKIIKQLMIENNISVKQLAEMLDIKPQSVSNKLYRDNFTLDEFVKLTELLDADIKVVSRSNGKEFILDKQ